MYFGFTMLLKQWAKEKRDMTRFFGKKQNKKKTGLP